ncbi:MAG TPA: hypothetical protein VF406_10650 [Thermodesulfobacteriota bacterium]
MRLLVLIGALVLLVLLVRSMTAGGGRRTVEAARRRVAGEELVRDPICDTYVPRSAAVSAAVGGETRLFCSRACAERYRAAAS